MKQYILSIMILAVLGMGCGKSSGDGQVSIQKKWSLVCDSTYGGFGMRVIYDGSVYVGMPSDYWDFRKDGNVYVKEGNRLDTFAYTLESPSTIRINHFGITINGQGVISTIKKLTAHEAVIQSEIVIPPGGPNYKVLYLRR